FNSTRSNCCVSVVYITLFIFFFSSRRRHTRFSRDWSSDVCSSDLVQHETTPGVVHHFEPQAQIVQQQAVAEADQREAVVFEKGRSEERRVGKECRSRWAE